MRINSNYKYTKSHEWVANLTDGKYRIGITDYAQNALGDIVYVNMPSVGDAVEIGKSFADVESVKAVAELYSPVSGKICEVNDAVGDTPGLLNSEPFESWIITVADVIEIEELLTPEEYEEFCKTAG
jgi:glycine cleavage system H protein